MGVETAHCWGALTWRHLCNIPERKKPTTDGIMGLVSFPSSQEHYLWNCYISLSEDPSTPEKRWLDGGLNQTFIRASYQINRAFRYFHGSSKNLAAGLRWLCVYLKGESQGGLRIARGDSARRSRYWMGTPSAALEDAWNPIWKLVR